MAVNIDLLEYGTTVYFENLFEGTVESAEVMHLEQRECEPYDEKIWLISCSDGRLRPARSCYLDEGMAKAKAAARYHADVEEMKAQIRTKADLAAFCISNHVYDCRCSIERAARTAALERMAELGLFS